MGVRSNSAGSKQANAVNATSDPASHHHCSGGDRRTVVAALVVWASRSLRGSPDSGNLKLIHYPEGASRPCEWYGSGTTTSAGGEMDKGLTAGGGMILGMIFGMIYDHMVLGMIIGLLIGAAAARRRRSHSA